MKSRWGNAGVIPLIVALVAVNVTGCGSGSGDAGGGQDEAVLVERGSLVSAITAIGSVVPRAQWSHAFGVPGRVAEVLVEAGDRVEAGETLARLDTAERTLQLQSAEATRAGAQAQLDQLEAGARPEEIAAARANLEAAAARLAAAEEDLAELEDDARASDAQLRAAETNVAVLRAQRDATEAQRDLLVGGPTAAERAAAEAQLAQAGVAVAGARLALGEAELTSVAAGLVARVEVTVGQWVAPAAPVIVVIDDSDYRVEVDVDETDIGAVQFGQEALLTLDAFLGRQLTGRVVAIAPTATFDLGVVTYAVTIQIDPADLPLRAGLTANAEIIRASRENVLLVPNLAITVAEPGGLKTVTRRTAAGDEQVTIEIGLSTDLWSEVLSGLGEGDQVVVSSFSSRDQLQRAMEAYLQGGGGD